jgi:5'-nucleotidase
MFSHDGAMRDRLELGPWNGLSSPRVSVRHVTSLRQPQVRRAAVCAAALSWCALLAWAAGSALDARSSPEPPTMILSIVGTNDVHGYVFPFDERGGLTMFGGYVNNLRAARAADGGAVVLLDAGDTFQGGIESNLSEGALVVDAYNALGYTAAAIGNHEFDFGPLDAFDPADLPDPRGALKAVAAQARYPLLAANLLDESTGRPVAWPNVRPSALVHAAGLRVGIVGAMTIDGLRATLAVNVHGLRLAPLAPTVAAEAAKLREGGADLVLLTIHAGGRCTSFDDPSDLSSCDGSSEIFRLIRDLPPGTLDAVVAGHTHAGLAHLVNGVPVIESLWGGRAFGRIDLRIDRRTRRVVHVELFPPQDVCAMVQPAGGGCAPATAPTAVQARYEDRSVEPDDRIVHAMAPALQRVRALQAGPLHVTIDTPVRRAADVGAPLGNLFADALRESTPGADVAVNNNGIGGLRADLPAGPLTFGRLYNVFPFDNRLVRLTLTGAQLQRVFAAEIARARPGALAISGITVSAACDGDDLRVAVRRAAGDAVGSDEPLQVVTTDMLAGGAVFAPVAPPSGFVVPVTAPLAREVVAGWLRRRGGHVSEAPFMNGERRWNYSPSATARCQVH